MRPPSLHTGELQALAARLRQGDEAARDELIRRAQGRLERLARRILGSFPSVRRHTETLELLNACLLRMLRALQTVHFASTRDFYSLAAVQMRRELLDLARQVSRRREAPQRALDAGDSAAQFDTVDPSTASTERLELWGRFHEEVAALPTEQREVVGLAFYHGWTHAQIAELLGVDERTVRRYWAAAILQLSQKLGQFPQP